MRLAQTEALLGNLAETNRLYRCVLGGISLYYRFHRHVAADICSIRQASIKQSSPCEQRLPALELHYNHYVAYHHEIKPYATTIAFDGGYVAEFDSVIDLGLGFILLEGKEPRLLADTKHLPPANYKFFCPTVQMHTETRALLSLPEHMREIDEGPVIIMPSYVQNYYHWICDSLV
jgi:hypothetical protein